MKNYSYIKLIKNSADFFIAAGFFPELLISALYTGGSDQLKNAWLNHLQTERARPAAFLRCSGQLDFLSNQPTNFETRN